MVFQNIVMRIFESNKVEVKKQAEENYKLNYENSSFFFPSSSSSSSSMALQSNANFRLLHGLFPVNSAFTSLSNL